MPRLIATSDVVSDPDRNWISDDTAGARPLAPDNVAAALNDNLTDDGGNPLTVSEAIETYLRFNKSKINETDNMARAEYARYNQYPRILEGDRRFQDEYDLTTATLTRRLSPLSDAGDMLTPWELSEQLHGGGVQESIRGALDYQLAEHDWEWCAVTTPREGSGAPEEHMHLWINDPADEVTPAFLESARDRHLEYVPNAYEDDHRFQADGGGGAIEVSTDPEQREVIPEQIAAIITHSDYTAGYPTRSAHFVATKLPDLIVWDYYDDDQPTPPLTLQEGAAAGWAVPPDWFRTSSGMPRAEDFPPYE